jgi:signal transduction histidine kinase
MRAPLRAMSAFTQILSEEAPSLSPEAADYCRRIGSAANRLDKLIEDTLSYTRTVQEDLKLEPVDLSRLLRGLIETYPNLQSDKADIEIEGELPVVLGNEALLTQCFSNLLGNAVKFVALGVRPRVRIQSEKLDHSIRIWIIDNGIGIAEQYRERIFHMFQRLSNEYEGTGIGLAIVRKVTERMGGGVGVESEPGQGSRFWITLRVPA